jgi:hypothetical protein
MTVTGAGFTATDAIAIGGEALIGVTVVSPTSLSATLPAGLCPGTYLATVTNARGEQASGGHLLVSGASSVTVAGSLNAPAFALTGKDQQLAVPLPALELLDTTCAAAARFTVSVSVSTIVAGRRHDLTLSTITLATADAGATMTAALTTVNTTAQATLAVPTTRRTPVTWQPSVTVLLPANAYAGPYTVTMTVGVAR